MYACGRKLHVTHEFIKKNEFDYIIVYLTVYP